MAIIINTFKALQTNALGTINLVGLPLILFIYLQPAGIPLELIVLLAGLATGLRLYFMHKKAARNLINTLQYRPTGQHLALTDEILQPNKASAAHVSIRYAYTQEGIAMAIDDVVVIDPMLMSLWSDDPQAFAVQEIYAQHIAPTLTEKQLERLTKTKLALTAPAQRFILRHEIGHILQRFTSKKLILIGLTGFIMTIAAFYAAIWTIAIAGSLSASIFGIVVGMMSDLSVTYLINVTYKRYCEIDADRYAAQTSSVEEITAAAEFFDRHQEIIDATTEYTNLFSYLPCVIASGHENGHARATKLRRRVTDSNQAK